MAAHGAKVRIATASLGTEVVLVRAAIAVLTTRAIHIAEAVARVDGEDAGGDAGSEDEGADENAGQN